MTTNKVRIVHMLRFGAGYTVILQCGYKYTVTAEQAKRDQLYIGRYVACAACSQEVTK